MFKNALEAHRIPTRPVDKIVVEPASYGGGYVLTMIIDGRPEMLVFTNQHGLTQYLTMLFNGSALAALQAPKARTETAADAISQPAPAGRKRTGRPPLTPEQKAERAAARKKLKANGLATAEVKAPSAVTEAEVGAEA